MGVETKVELGEAATAGLGAAAGAAIGGIWGALAGGALGSIVYDVFSGGSSHQYRLHKSYYK